MSDHDDSDASTTMTKTLLRRKTSAATVCRGPVDFVREFSLFLSEEPLTVFPSLDDFDSFTSSVRPIITSTSGAPDDDGFVPSDAPPRSLARARTLNGAGDTAVRRGRPDEAAGRRFTRSFTSGTSVHPAVEAARRISVPSEGSVEAGESWPTSPGAVRSPPTSPSLLSHQKIRASWPSSMGSPGPLPGPHVSRSPSSSQTVCSPAVRSKNEIMAQIFDAIEIRSWTEVVAKVVQEENAVTDVAPWTLQSPSGSPSSPGDTSSPFVGMMRRKSTDFSRSRSLQERNDIVRYRGSTEMRTPLELPLQDSDRLPMATSSVMSAVHFNVGSGTAMAS